MENKASHRVLKNTALGFLENYFIELLWGPGQGQVHVHDGPIVDFWSEDGCKDKDQEHHNDKNKNNQDDDQDD
ncbi:hypothetical protein CASFOL_001839 [Castilleja foliolosa]|uniref:Uncharacterized protein n=1 Tax=Castilleja foliolosa TaxID=1961234 RepID=A0ABD3ECV2_9LAMI